MYDDEMRWYYPGGFKPDWYPDEHDGKSPEEAEEER